MEQKSLINQLQLAYAPVSTYEFSFLKDEKIIQDILSESKLYVFAQRPLMTFENLDMGDEQNLKFEIKQDGAGPNLKCQINCYQDSITSDKHSQLEVRGGKLIGMHAPGNSNTLVHGLQFFQKDNFLYWCSPDKFLHNYWSGDIDATIEGDLMQFTKYKVLYVGKATDQAIIDRLTGHNTLQHILSVEVPFNYGTLPSYEIVILFFRFYDNLALNVYGPESNVDEIVGSLTGDSRPDQRTIFLDAEKAFVSAMQPKHNKVYYKKYPASKDGLYSHNLDSYSYSIQDDITLLYDDGKIVGSSEYMKSDFILIKGDTVKIFNTN